MLPEHLHLHEKIADKCHSPFFPRVINMKDGRHVFMIQKETSRILLLTFLLWLVVYFFVLQYIYIWKKMQGRKTRDRKTSCICLSNLREGELYSHAQNSQPNMNRNEPYEWIFWMNTKVKDNYSFTSVFEDVSFEDIALRLDVTVQRVIEIVYNLRTTLALALLRQI